MILSSYSYQAFRYSVMTDESPTKFSLAKEDHKHEETRIASPVRDVGKKTEQSKSKCSHFFTILII